MRFTHKRTRKIHHIGFVLKTLRCRHMKRHREQQPNNEKYSSHGFLYRASSSLTTIRSVSARDSGFDCTYSRSAELIKL